MSHYANPVNWDPESDDPRDLRMHGVQIAFGRIYATGAFGKFPNESLEVARQAAFALVDYAATVELEQAIQNR